MESNQNLKQENINKEEKNISTKGKQEEMTAKEKYDDFWNKIFLVLIPVSLVGLYYFIRDISNWRKLLNSIDPDYKLPGWDDMKICLYLIPIIAVIKIFSKKPITQFCCSVMKEAYRHPKNDKDRQLYEKYKEKLPDHLFKIIFYVIITIFGFCILRNLDYFPKTLGGVGHFSNIIKNGYPGCFLHERPPHFAFYYMFALSFFACDSIWFIFAPRQTDYINMVLHHIVTISLITFSYFTNISNIGCVVLFLHVFSDIFVHVTRFFLQTDAPEFIKSFWGIFLVFIFIYVRMFVLGTVLYTLWHLSDFSWHRICWFLYIFVLVLYLMHINWTFMLLQKFFALLGGTKITDTTYYKTKSQKNENNNDQKQKKQQ